MTRINIVPVEEVTDLHLLAERKEMVRVPNYLRKSIRANKVIIPEQYTMGKGHVKFFYNKGLWLENRFNSVLMEMIKRGMNPNLEAEYPVDLFKQMGFYNDWSPSPIEIEINRERINFMISKKPHLYKTSSTDGWMLRYINKHI